MYSHKTNNMDSETNRLALEKFTNTWSTLLSASFPHYKEAVDKFITDDDKGLQHSFEVYNRSRELAYKVEASGTRVYDNALQTIAIFHDIGKFFQDMHSWENLNIAVGVFSEYTSLHSLSPEFSSLIEDAIINSDFYNTRLDPPGKLPRSLEGLIVRCADKMLDNIVRKVDRYWYEYGEPRGEKFFDPAVTLDTRRSFNFQNWDGDQLNAILSIIALRPEDMGHPILEDEYRKWQVEWKQKAVDRILHLAIELGESKENIKAIGDIVNWYRSEFKC